MKIEKGPKNPDLRADFFFLLTDPSGKRMHSIASSSFKAISFGGEKWTHDPEFFPEIGL